MIFDWDDVRQVRTGRVVQVRVKDREAFTGTLVVDAKTVRVLGTTEQQFDRAGLISITPGEPREASYWSGNATFGFNLRRGNSDQVEANTVASARRRTVTSRVILDYVGNYNVTDETTVTNNQRVYGGIDWFVTSRFFVRPITLEYFRDPFQNFAQRWAIGEAVGYQLIDTSRVSWEFNVGPAYQRTTFADCRKARLTKRARSRWVLARHTRTNSPRTSTTRSTTASCSSSPRLVAIRITS